MLNVNIMHLLCYILYHVSIHLAYIKDHLPNKLKFLLHHDFAIDFLEQNSLLLFLKEHES